MIPVSKPPSMMEELNDSQRECVINYEGPSYAISGPGSGKTKTIVARIAYMIADGVNPSNILAFTFTRKAAGELRERVTDLVGTAGAQVTIGTYHSFCAKVLRDYATYAGYKRNFTIYDETDRSKVLKRISGEEDFRRVGSAISKWKEKMMGPVSAAMSPETAGNRFLTQAAGIYAEYQRLLKEQNALDFDDLVFQTVLLLQQNATIQEALNDKYQFVMTDETQDSSLRDIQLIKLLSGPNQNIFLCFDDCQGIYSFRGADVNSLYQFLESMPFVKYVLGQNYRSTKTIVDASTSLIDKNKNRLEKSLYTYNGVGEKIVVAELSTQVEEANYLVKTIQVLRRVYKLPWSDVMVLYRVSAQSRILEEALIRNSIPYTIVGGLPFFARKEIKDIMAYMRLVYNPSDREAFERVLNTPKRGLGEKALQQIINLSNGKNYDNLYIDTCKALMQSVKGKQRSGLTQLVSVMEKIQGIAHENPATIVESIVEWIQYDKYLMEEKDSDDRWSNVLELANVAASCGNLEDLIESSSLSTSLDLDEENSNRVKLMTIHGSKGLESPVVIIVGANQGTIPHRISLQEGNAEEERRLFYVAMTRAKSTLFITRPKSIFVNGSPQFPKASQFLSEIDSRHILKVLQNKSG